MIILLLFPLTLFAASQKPYLVPCDHDPAVNCLVRSSRAPRNQICQVSGHVPDETKGDEIIQEKVKTNPDGEPASIMDRALNFIGIKELAEDEMIVCRLDTAKRDKRVGDEKAAREAEERAKRDKKDAEKIVTDEMLAVCRTVQTPASLKNICAYLRMKEGDL